MKKNTTETAKSIQETEFRVSDRRFWVEGVDSEESSSDASGLRLPSYVESLQENAAKADERVRIASERLKEIERDTDLFRQRLQRDVDRRVEVELAGAFSEFAELFDCLHQSIQASSEKKGDPFFDGMALILARFQSFLEKHDVSRISVLHQDFDPRTAEAIDLIPTADPKEDQKVLEELRPAFKYKDRLLCPAKVRVGKFTGTTA